MIDFLCNPIVILGAAAVALAVILPWLKRKAKETETVLDDRIITLLEVWIQTAVTKLLRK